MRKIAFGAVLIALTHLMATPKAGQAVDRDLPPLNERLAAKPLVQNQNNSEPGQTTEKSAFSISTTENGNQIITVLLNPATLSRNADTFDGYRKIDRNWRKSEIKFQIPLDNDSLEGGSFGIKLALNNSHKWDERWDEEFAGVGELPDNYSSLSPEEKVKAKESAKDELKAANEKVNQLLLTEGIRGFSFNASGNKKNGQLIWKAGATYTYPLLGLLLNWNIAAGYVTDSNWVIGQSDLQITGILWPGTENGGVTVGVTLNTGDASSLAVIETLALGTFSLTTRTYQQSQFNIGVTVLKGFKPKITGGLAFQGLLGS